MHTAFFLMARHNVAVIPVDVVVRDYFPHLTVPVFVRRVSVGEIDLPMVRIEPNSRKSAKGVHIIDLATYIEARRDAASAEATERSLATK